MSMRAKFKVERVSTTTYGTELELSPVTNGSEENKKFFKMTPFGSIKVGVVAAETAEQFKPGDEFYVDFTPA